jgi:methylmalonyl-CoA mutase N-terminal domain/subunit
VRAIEEGLFQQEIADAAYGTQQAIESRAQVVVGVNRFGSAEEAQVPVFYPNEAVAHEQAESLARIRAARDAGAVTSALEHVRAAAAGTTNPLDQMREALRLGATLGEICGVLRETWGEYRPSMGL